MARPLTPRSEGGATNLDNTALLCGRCHRELHRGYWDLVIGPDGHPWIAPPAPSAGVTVCVDREAE